ncbi:MAG: hypothetical protein IM628_12700 [Phenylobacterium sp.]|uniref:hypothetical protein n=1 Tax=Phenylobacterium sp. TaxID=1871053 RepID=UPI0025F57610|nr:hypothetical protein [Phenylobacterium sp.]MCA6305657.1 hypothetical protein [Phenylobacterium sp.]
MDYLIFWALMGIATGMAAHAKGLNVGGWIVYGLLLGPIALIHSIVAKPPAPAEPPPPPAVPADAGDWSPGQTIRHGDRRVVLLSVDGDRARVRLGNSEYVAPLAELAA